MVTRVTACAQAMGWARIFSENFDTLILAISKIKQLIQGATFRPKQKRGNIFVFSKSVKSRGILFFISPQGFLKSFLVGKVTSFQKYLEGNLFLWLFRRLFYVYSVSRDRWAKKVKKLDILKVYWLVVYISVYDSFVSQENMMQDLTAVRELCMKLDQTRESLSRQLAAKSLDHEQVRLKQHDSDITPDSTSSPQQ